MQPGPGIRLRPSLWHVLDGAARQAFPLVSTALVLVLLSVPLGLPGQSALRPAFALACVFFWALHRPRAMPPAFAFLIGLLADLLGSAPVGIGLIGVLMCHGLALRWRLVLARQEYLIEWLAFCAAALAFAALTWGFDSLFAFSLLPPQPAVFLAALAAGCYPILALVLVVAQHRVVEAEDG